MCVSVPIFSFVFLFLSSAFLFCRRRSFFLVSKICADSTESLNKIFICLAQNARSCRSSFFCAVFLSHSHQSLAPIHSLFGSFTNTRSPRVEHLQIYRKSFCASARITYLRIYFAISVPPALRKPSHTQYTHWGSNGSGNSKNFTNNSRKHRSTINFFSALPLWLVRDLCEKVSFHTFYVYVCVCCIFYPNSFLLLVCIRDTRLQLLLVFAYALNVFVIRFEGSESVSCARFSPWLFSQTHQLNNIYYMWNRII